MSKINQIQNALNELEGGVFQKLCDAYLKAKGFGAINPIGSVIGNNKTKIGTPDTFIRQDDGQMVFVEYTTQKTGVISKFTDDLDKCLDESKTGVPLSDISQLIFCHTSLLDADEEHTLVKLAQKKGIVASVKGIGPISFDLYKEFPGLAKDFLGVEIDTGQILAPKDFVNYYDRNALVTPLETDFFFREEDITHSLDHLDHNDLLIISGAAGVGKSRLALEVIRQYRLKHGDCEAFCIANKGQDLFEDIKVYFSPAGHFVILVDDANRTTGFEYLVDLIKTKRADQSIKVIATVRDYALDKVKENARELGLVPELVVKPFEKQELHKLIEGLFEINNPLWLERIFSLSAGNPRLAVMAASHAKDHEGLNSINDVSELYDSYFSSIRDDLAELGGEDFLMAAGITSFFRSVDNTNDNVMREIESVFGVERSVFWAACQALHNCELVDIYEDEVVKISDQVVATYLFNLCFFKGEIGSFDVVFDNFFPKYASKVRDALYPCLNAFDLETISEKISGPVKGKLKSALEADDTQLVTNLFNTFYFVLESETLKHIRDQITSLDQEDVELETICWEKPNTNVPKNDLVNLLKLFAGASMPEFEMAVQLALMLVERQPSAAPDLIYLLTENYGFGRHSHHWNYIKQVRLIEMLIERSRTDEGGVFSRLFLAISKTYLHTQFDETEGGRRQVTIHKFRLIPNDTIKNLRKDVWDHIFELAGAASLAPIALEVLSDYASSGYYVDVKELQEFDAVTILPRLVASLDPEQFSHAFVIEKVLKSMSHLELEGIEALPENCSSSIMSLFRLLDLDIMDFDRDENERFDQMKLSRIADHSKDYVQDDYSTLMQQYMEIVSAVGRKDSYRHEYGLTCFFTALADRDQGLFVEVVTGLLASPGVFEEEIRSQVILQRLFEFCSPEEVRKIIKGDGACARYQWQIAYFLAIPQQSITARDLDRLYTLMKNKDCSYTLYWWDDLKKYTDVDEQFYVKLTKIINQRMKDGGYQGDPYGLLFNSHTDVCKDLKNIFATDIDVLKEAYLLHDNVDKHADYDGFVMNQILDVDPSFLCEYFSYLCEGKPYFSYYDDRRQYGFLWCREDAAEILNTAIDLLVHLSVEKEYYCNGFMSCLFTTDKHKRPKEEVIEEQNRYLEVYLADNHENPQKMEMIFEAIAQFEKKRKLRFVAQFLALNTDYSVFEKLSLESTHRSWSGSAVPMLSRRKEFWTSVLTHCNKVELLDHRRKCENVIERYNREIEHEKKRDFVDEW